MFAVDSAMDKFDKKFYDKPGLQNWLADRWREVEATLEKKFQTTEDILYNMDKWIDDPFLGYLMVSNNMFSEYEKLNMMLEYMINNNYVCSLIGGKGSGKTGLCSMLVDELKHYMPVAWFDFNQNLPSFIKTTLSWDDIEDGSLVVVDEAGLTFLSREAMGSEHKDLSKLLMISRHRDMKIIFNSQHMLMTDINIFRLSDCFLFKRLQMTEVADLQKQEQSRRNTFLQYVSMMQPRSFEETLWTNGDRWLQMETGLPDWWSEEISKGYSKMNVTNRNKFIQEMFKGGVSPKMMVDRLKARGFTMDIGDIMQIAQMDKDVLESISRNETGYKHCDDCESINIQKYGTDQRRGQRYKCMDCGHVFYDKQSA